MRGLSVRGARRLTGGGVLGQSVEHGEQAQRSNGRPVMCLARQPVRNAGWHETEPRAQATGQLCSSRQLYKKGTIPDTDSHEG